MPMKGEWFQKASQSNLPPQPNLNLVDMVVAKNTRFPENRRHRYTWFRYWGDPNHYCAFIGMNPSGADEVTTDRTANRCREFAEAWGFGAIYLLNTFSLRETNSAVLLTNANLVGPDNDYWIREITKNAARVVAAWGEKSAKGGRGKEIDKILFEVCDPDRIFCFGRNNDGSPKHPLYQPANQNLVPYFLGAK